MTDSTYMGKTQKELYDIIQRDEALQDIRGTKSFDILMAQAKVVLARKALVAARTALACADVELQRVSAP